MNNEEMIDYESLEDEVYVFENLKAIINIFNFDFLSLFLFDEDITYDDILMDKNKDIKKKFKNSKEFFNQKKLIEKFNYFNFQIIYGVNNICGSYQENNKFLCRYLFSNTKNDKYFFKSFFQYITSGDDSNINFIQEDYRICNQRNYNDYFFINKKMKITGFGKDFLNEDLTENDFNVNTFSLHNNDQYDLSMEFLYLLKEFKDNNKLEELEFDYLDIDEDPNFFDNLKKFKKLRVFKIKKGCLLSNEELITLLKCLYECKYLFVINISFDKNSFIFDKKEKNEIYKLFPNISIQKSNIIWHNNKAIIKIK